MEKWRRMVKFKLYSGGAVSELQLQALCPAGTWGIITEINV